MPWRALLTTGRWLPLCAALGMGNTLALTTSSAAAQSTGLADQRRLAARDLAQRGLEAYQRGDYEGALELNRRAYRIVPAPSILIQIARAEREAGRWVEAAEAYRATSRSKLDAASPEAYRTAVLDAEDELAALEPRLPRLRIVLDAATETAAIEVTQDGIAVPAPLRAVAVPVNPGRHELRAIAANGMTAVETIEIREGESKDVVLHFTGHASTSDAPAQRAPQPERTSPAPRLDTASPAPTMRVLGYAGLGIGAAGIGVGVVTGLMALSRRGVVDEECPSTRCAAGSSGADALDEFRSLRTISTIGYVSGAVFAGAGVSLLLLAPRSMNGGVSVGVRPTGVSLTGEF